MLTKLYALLWLAVGAAMGTLFLAGAMNTMALVVFGFILFALLFGGLISVLPFWATHQTSNKH